ncbi:MAG: putative esterase [Myxococcales bacterium]|nr:putative esterase [Myxococcales bacterium]
MIVLTLFAMETLFGSALRCGLFVALALTNAGGSRSPLAHAGPPPQAAAPTTDAAPPKPGQVVHETLTMMSKALGERRRIHLYTPPGFAKLAGPLPVLYLLDGGDEEDFPHPGVLAAIDLAIRTGEMRPLAVVGIENTERRRDTTGPTQVDKDKQIAAHVGGSAAFRAFIRDELMPMVKQKVPRAGKTAIAGESLAGLFVIETLFVEPGLFDTWIAVSPSLWWNDQALAREADRWMKAHPRATGTLYLARAGDDIGEPIDALAAALRSSAPPGLSWYYEPRSDLRHSNIYENVAPALVRRLWPPAGGEPRMK